MPVEAVALLANGNSVSLTMEGVRWARRFISDTQQGATPRKVNDVVQAGQQIWVRKVGDSWWLSQLPDVNSALVSINPQNGAIIALVGGFDLTRANSTAPPVRCARSAPTLNRSSIPPRWIKA